MQTGPTLLLEANEESLLVSLQQGVYKALFRHAPVQMTADLVGDGSNVVIGLGGGVPLGRRGVVLRLVVLPLQPGGQLKGHQPHGGGGGALDLALQVTSRLGR